jgi:hypothetical protein
MTAGAAVAVAVVFGWLGMVVAISFIEAPLKFRAPGITLQIGLGIGRLVFRALNTVEAVLAAILIVALTVDPPRPATIVTLALAVAALVVQLLAVRPSLNRRSDAVLSEAGTDGRLSRSRAHYAYVGLEVVKVAALAVGGVLLLIR